MCHNIWTSDSVDLDNNSAAKDTFYDSNPMNLRQ